MEPAKFNAMFVTGIIIITIIYIIISYVIIRINFKPILDWAAQQNAKKYKDKFNMMSLVTAKSNPIIFWIHDNFFTPPLGRLNIASTRFLLMNVLTHATYIDDNTGQAGGIVTMRSLCESVLPNYKDPYSKDLIFDDYILKGYCKRGNYPVEPSATTGLKYTQISYKATQDGEFMNGTTFFHYTIDPSCLITGENGVKKAPLWPDPSAHEHWAGLIIEWLNGTITTSENYCNKNFPKADESCALHFYWVNGENGVDIIENTSTKSQAGKASMDTKYKFWFGTDNSGGALGNPPGDNWISRMGLPFNSPLVVGFVNNKYTMGGIKMDPTAFSNLVGGVSGGVAGGWVGFCQGRGDVSADELWNFLSTAAEWQPTPSPPPCKKSAVGGVLGFMGPMLGAGLFAIATGGWGAVAMMGVGAVQGGIAAYQSQQC